MICLHALPSLSQHGGRQIKHLYKGNVNKCHVCMPAQIQTYTHFINRSINTPVLVPPPTILPPRFEYRDLWKLSESISGCLWLLSQSLSGSPAGRVRRMREAYRVVRCTLRVTTCSCCPRSARQGPEWAVAPSPLTAKCQGSLHQYIVLSAPQQLRCELFWRIFSSVFSSVWLLCWASFFMKFVTHLSWKPIAMSAFTFT